jgi:hypothetical protein
MLTFVEICDILKLVSTYCKIMIMEEIMQTCFPRKVLQYQFFKGGHLCVKKHIWSLQYVAGKLNSAVE